MRALFSFHIARRYFLSSKGQSFINIIAIFSMLALAVGTFLLFFVLSVFNGLSGLIMGVHSTFDPEIKVTAVDQKTFPVNDSLLTVLENISGVEVVTSVIEEDAFANLDQSQRVVRLKGVSENINEQTDFRSAIVEGEFKLEDEKSYYAVLGRGIQYGLNASLSDKFHAIQLWYPNRKKKLIKENQSSFNQIYVMPSGVFEIERQYDDKYMIVPIGLTEKLFSFEGERTGLEIKTSSDAEIYEVIDRLESMLGNGFEIKSREEQHEILYRAIKIEKFATYMIFLFILLVASLNIFLTLSMLVISKKKDISILYALGANRRFIKKIFLYEGALIGLVGTSLGLILSIVFCYIQQNFGVIGMSVESSIVQYLPVSMNYWDGLFTVGTTILITVGISIYPAMKASNVDIKEHL